MAPKPGKALSPVRHHILLALAERDRHGYAIRRAVHEASDGAVRLGPGTLYAALRRLEDAGLIAESAWRPDADLDDERRRYYQLTSEGKQVLLRETERLRAMVRLGDLVLSPEPEGGR